MLSGPQRHTLLVGGSRSGKTFLLTRQLLVRALRAPDSRHAIFRLRYNALRAAVWLDTLPKVMRMCWPQVDYESKRQDGYVLLPNGAEVWFAGLDDKERVEKILGLEFATAYFNECSQIPFGSVLTGLTRLAQQVPGLQNRAYYDLNPTGTGHWTYRQFIEKLDPVSRKPLAKPEQYQAFYLNPVDNRANVDPDYIASLEAMPERQRRRFLDGRYVAEIDGALWTLETLERQRVLPEALPVMKRVVVAVDPSGCAGAEDYRSDQIGIVVAGVSHDGMGYVLADRSGRYSPEQWGRVVVNAWREFGADRIVYEKNFGGDMVRAVIAAADRNAPTKEVNASRGKTVRAEPVAALYESGRVFHAGAFPALEEQFSNFSTAGYLGDRSPDAADAAVWALTELMIGNGSDAFIEGMRLILERDRTEMGA